ncbi:hypothetical protein GCM10010510_68940 [Streptomyces anandii JCM 4720]|nr:hypothetical protein GCM10010510_68940 [Streptomyces anandii JCM 4720]
MASTMRPLLSGALQGPRALEVPTQRTCDPGAGPGTRDVRGAGRILPAQARPSATARTWTPATV